jgi:hypothetical protein
MARRIVALICLPMACALCNEPARYARACAVDNIASVRADGQLAIHNAVTPDGSTISRWAPFVFRKPFAHGQAITFSENLRELARTLPPDIVRGRWLWRFGDGATARGQVVSHRYLNARYYLLTVSMPLPHVRGTFVFDAVDIRVD